MSSARLITSHQLGSSAQLSSAPQRTTAITQQRSTVRGRAVRFCAVLFRAACFAALFRTCRVLLEVIISYPVMVQLYRYQGLYAPGTSLLKYKICTPSAAQPSYSSAAQRSAVRYRAVPCLALRCGAALYFEHTAPRVMRSTRYQASLCTCVLVFLLILLPFDCPLSVLMFLLYSQITPVYQNVTSPASTQHSTALHSTGQSALHKYIALGIIKSLVAPNYGLFFPPPSHLVVFFLSRV